MYAFGVSVHAPAMELKQLAGGIVQDRTGLTGDYDFTLKFCLSNLRWLLRLLRRIAKAVPAASGLAECRHS